MTTEKITIRTNPKIYNRWNKMRRKCFTVNSSGYEYCGGLGISICPEWNSYENFYYWALNSGYSDKLSLIRKDKTKDFSPDNCRWIELKEILKNKKNNHLLICPKTGKKQTLIEWARELKISAPTLSNRVNTMSIEKALTPGRLNKGCLNKRIRIRSKLRDAWSSMKRRTPYKDMNVCDSWLFYSNFEKWAYDNGYQENLMLGRKDTSKGFYPENCCWTTWQEINSNKKNSVKIYYDGEVLCLSQVAKKIGITASGMCSRLNSDVTTSEKLFCKGKQIIYKSNKYLDKYK